MIVGACWGYSPSKAHDHDERVSASSSASAARSEYRGGCGARPVRYSDLSSRGEVEARRRPGASMIRRNCMITAGSCQGDGTAAAVLAAEAETGAGRAEAGSAEGAARLQDVARSIRARS